ncbi:MAG: M23 family metallopeptidase [Nonlabens ulvanivorans]|uniref:Membrane proteins related to metalloendopeptidases n=1 Tax=Nonlabens ulvanivorans TaxID=906888 RepID=A0A090WCQ6_NONUL|nr:M23 family metallopeptidase [Nonlabens ulvanivorans]GAK98653.1 membrane proteins related to metalloendopeptidases [Nonlabens ulvanivorans]GAL73953.1 membrane proteins related to metalloendopeptidases [Nonlabens ulvanivorans]
MATKKEKGKLKRKWLHRYRMVVLNDDTFEERFSLNLTRLNVFIVTVLSAIILIGLTTVLIAFTPLREFIPGYASTKLTKDVITLESKTDSLLTSIQLQQQKYDRIQMVLSGNITAAEYARIDSIAKVETANQENLPIPIEEDSLLREEVDREDKFNVIEGATSRTNFIFFTPVTGTISDGFNAEKKHYAVDITSAANSPVKAAADGTVIFAGWSTDTGNTILMEHSYGVITVYKHMATLSKKQNDQVQAGEVIGIVGNTGELTNGPHLHFELWMDGYPQDPTNFINFQ